MIVDFEQNVFGYRIQLDDEVNEKKGSGDGQLIYKVPYKAMVGRSVKTPEEAVDHFLSLRNKKRGDETNLVDIIAEIKYDGERT